MLPRTVRVKLYSTKPLTTLRVRALEKPVFLEKPQSKKIDALLLKASPSGIEVLYDGGRAKTHEVLLRGKSFLLETDGKERRFTGELKVECRQGHLYPCLTLPFEDYVSGVALSEMPPRAAREAVKAQAIAARSYAAAQMKRHFKEGFDFCDSTHCQNFFQIPHEGNLKATIRSTQGTVLLFKGHPLEAFYHSTCGGRTAADREVFPGRLEGERSVVDPYCRISPHYRWSFTVPLKKIDEIFRPVTGFALKTLEITNRGPSGRVTELELAGSGRLRISGLRFWQRMGESLGWGKLESTLFEIRQVDNQIVFSGKGLGHGLGMCQWGALGMAEKGFDYQAILRYYYPGILLRRLDR
jgi:stage II sporulation protein D